MDVSLGIDFGATGLRAALHIPGRPVEVLPAGRPGWPWLLYEPAAAGPLPVSFPSLKARLGTVSAVTVAGRTVPPAEVVEQALAAVRERAVAAAGAPIARTAIAVPAGYTSVQRRALTQVASAAGLAHVGLVSDSLAAVIECAQQPESARSAGRVPAKGTYLSYGMGYEGFELGLIRVAGRNYRALGYDGGEEPGGRAFDAGILHACLAAWREHGAVPEEAAGGESGWMRLRGLTEQVKEQLSDDEYVLFPKVVSGTGDGVAVGIERRWFAEMVRLSVLPTLDRVDTLLGQAGMARADIDRVLLVGGSAGLAEVQSLVAGLGAPTTRTDKDHLARGAARYAASQADRPPAEGAAELPPAAREPARAPGLTVSVLIAPRADGPAPEPAGVVDFAAIRSLIGGPRHEEAEASLREIVRRAEALLAEAEAVAEGARGGSSDRGASGSGAPGSGSPVPADEREADATGMHLLSEARRLLAEARYAEAIDFAHRASASDPDHPDLFEAMIDIHCEAATAHPTIRSFAQEEIWLRCALQHDPSSTKVRRLLAERIYGHGRDLTRMGEDTEARRVLEHALVWNPEHTQARDLLRRLSRAAG